MSARLIAFFISVTFYCVPITAYAAEVSCLSFADPPKATCELALLNGEIRVGDYEKVRAFVSANSSTLMNFGLNSPGGSVEEALKIGRFFRKYLLEATTLSDPAPTCKNSNCACVSACALIWFGAVSRGGTVGVHRYTFANDAFRRLSAPDASSEYRQGWANILAYLTEMEVPNSVIEAMTSTSSNDIRWVSAFDPGLDHPPSIAEWVDASCGPFPADDLDGELHHLVCEYDLYKKSRDTGFVRRLFGLSR